MEAEEARQISEEIESEEFEGEDEPEEDFVGELSEEDIESMEEGEAEDLEALFGTDEDPEKEVVQVTKTITVVGQPIITSVMVGAEVGAKGEVKPVCKVSIERHHEGDDGAEIEVFDIIADDFAELAGQVEEQILRLKGRMN